MEQPKTIGELNLKESSGLNHMSAELSTKDISVDLDWIDMLKGIAIIGVFLDNWTGYMKFTTTPLLLYSFANSLSLAFGPFVQVFFILSGFGLTIGYFRRHKTHWSGWAWRRITKIVIPYMILVFFSFGAGVLGSNLYGSVDVKFSLIDLLAYLTFTRNFYRPSWVWNPALWFMPTIVGLYLTFPFLLEILKRWGPRALLLISFSVTYGALITAFLAGNPAGHGADLFAFYTWQFALGMALAYLREIDPQRFRRLIGWEAFLVGLALMICSWALRTYTSLGARFNDPVTSLGIFLTLLNLVWTARAIVPTTGKVLNSLSSKSYLMYLIHYPIMAFLIGPPLRVPINPIIVMTLGALYIFAIYFLCAIIARPMDRISS